LAARNGSRVVTRAKRTFDIALALSCAVLLALPVVFVAVALLLRQGRPIFHASERMAAPDVSFVLWKFRTMHVSTADSGVSGGDKAARITPIGHFLRRTRLDEVPQLWNILRGDMTFVGPRPPLRNYVERFPGLYARILQSRPGVTGLATVVLHAREGRLLAVCATAAQTDAVYVRRCVPVKARVDLLYQQKQTLLLDISVLFSTVRAVCKKGSSA
jgi:lipopolysaccharide/colanic/teichoic acid biosynthesis glycosyltransferase